MSVIFRVASSVPPYALKQTEAKQLIGRLVTNQRLIRYLDVFDHTEIDTRYFSVSSDWFMKNHGLNDRNQIFIDHGIDLAEEAIIKCMNNSGVQFQDIDAVFTVTSTGILTPSLEVHMINRLPFRTDIKRYPFFGLGCAGGGIGLSRAHDYLKAYPEQAVLVVAVELASVAFHCDRLEKQDIVGAAIFSDGASCVLLLGSEHPYVQHQTHKLLNISSTSSQVLKDSMDIMGWDVKDDGFYVVFDTMIPKLVNSFYKQHLEAFLENEQLSFNEVEQVLAHPGGRKIIENIEEIMLPHQSIASTKRVLNNYGNMSSPTLLFVIEDALNSNTLQERYHIASALGPGFTSEIILLEWK